VNQEIYIIRHGETDYNKKGIVQGRGVDRSLNETGRKQGLAFFQAYQNTPFQKVYTSALQRSAQTVESFKVLDIPFEKRPQIDEIDWGDHEGKLYNSHLSKEYSKMLAMWKSGKVDVGIPGGESPLDVQNRVSIFIKEILSKNESPILVCCHGRTMRILLCTMLSIELSKMDEFPHQNVCLYKVIHNGQKFEVDQYNDTTHLNGKI
jgi:probable phosphoglycerate mutase